MVIAYWDRVYGTDHVTGQHYDTDNSGQIGAFANAVYTHPERFSDMSAQQKQDVIDRAKALGVGPTGTSGGFFGW